MAAQHIVRVSTMGHVGRFDAVDATCYPRGTPVIVRTQRGLEVGEILTPPDVASKPGPSDGAILRGMTVEDELLQARLLQNRDQALDACTAMLADRNLPATLLDVETLFDGTSLYFYFLGDVDAEVEAVTAELAETYETQAQLRKFGETLTEGCGPGCGTEDATGGGCDSCSSCAVAGACGVKRKAN